MKIGYEKNKKTQDKVERIIEQKNKNTLFICFKKWSILG